MWAFIKIHMRNPLISIIIPAYNCADTLSRAVFSALRQTYNNIEIIIVDDGSTDNRTPTLCDTLQKRDKRVRVLHKMNGRQASARNAGLHICQGEYVLFLDGDDEYEPNLCEKVVINLDDHVDIILYGFNIYQNKKLLRTPNPGDYWYKNDNWNIFDKHIRFLMASPCNKLYRRSYISTLFDETCVYGEDALFNYSNFHKGTCIRTIHDCLYNVYLDNLQSVNKSYKLGRLADSVKNIICIEQKLEEIFLLSDLDKTRIKSENITQLMSECYNCLIAFPFDIAKSEIRLHLHTGKAQAIMQRRVHPEIKYLKPLYFFLRKQQYRIASIYCIFIRISKVCLKRIKS